MVTISADRVRKLDLKQIHDLATEQYILMSLPEYKDIKKHSEEYRESGIVNELTQSFNSTKDFTVMGSYALDAIVMAGIAEKHKDKFTDDELTLLSHSWNQLFARDKAPRRA